MGKLLGRFWSRAAGIALMVVLAGVALAVPQPAAANTSCLVQLQDAPGYRTVPLPLSGVNDYIHYWILKGYVTWDAPGWPNQGSLSFRNCRPMRLLLVGDSIPFSFGVPMLDMENRYGVELADAAIPGCGFMKRGLFYNLGEFWQAPSVCPDAPIPWGQEADEFHADAVVIEEGYRDEFDYSWNGQIVHLGDPAFDTYVVNELERYVRVLGRGGRRPVVLMTIPYDHSRMKDGSIAATALPIRHQIINQLIQSVARKHPGQVLLFDTDKVISPGNHYDQTLNGNQCRLRDRIHLSIYCSLVLEPKLLSATLRLIKAWDVRK